ncbi:aromatic-amino-acid aminotransferase [Penicillium sp. IBT 18751x]|nr:aromatic-amino-acid aminotransferase [Penicillium sp. IBT 18751x]
MKHDQVAKMLKHIGDWRIAFGWSLAKSLSKEPPSTVLGSLGVSWQTFFKSYDHERKGIDIELYYSTLERTEPKFVVILHVCAHGPTDFDPSEEQWCHIAHLMRVIHLCPSLDAACLGFNSANLDDDAFAMCLLNWGNENGGLELCVHCREHRYLLRYAEEILGDGPFKDDRH